MAVLAVGAIGAGLVQVPGVDDVIVNFLRPTFADSPLYEPHTRDGLLIFGLGLGTVLGARRDRDRLRHLGRAARSIAVDRCASGSGPLYELLWSTSGTSTS